MPSLEHRLRAIGSRLQSALVLVRSSLRPFPLHERRSHVMCRICLIMLAGLAVTLLAAGPVAAEKVEIKGPHICCPQCIKIVGGILGKVDGVSDAKCDKEAKTINFTAKDEATVKSALKALVDGGFFGTATCDDKEVKLEVATIKSGDKADKVSVQKVHVCCGQCQKAIKGIFKDAN